jgi:hypothetical protein
VTDPGWRLTVRHGPDIERHHFDDLDSALAALRERAAEIAREGGLEPAQGFREYEPGERVHARLALSSGPPWRRREAGVDLMGDGAVVPYAGALRRHPLEGRTPDRALEAVAVALR